MSSSMSPFEFAPKLTVDDDLDFWWCSLPEVSCNRNDALNEALRTPAERHEQIIALAQAKASQVKRLNGYVEKYVSPVNKVDIFGRKTTSSGFIPDDIFHYERKFAKRNEETQQVPTKTKSKWFHLQCISSPKVNL